MSANSQFVSRIDGLIGRINSAIMLSENMIALANERIFGECRSLIYAVKNLCRLMFEGEDTAYAVLLNRMELSEDYTNLAAQENLATMSSLVSLLENIKDDIAAGLLGSVVSRTQAHVFDDFIDHADHYLEEGRKNEAGVIAGVTFEDTIRRLSAKHAIEEKGRKLNLLIDDLVKKNILTSLEAKRARVGADIRTKATHAQWDEVDEGVVKELIGFLRSNLILKLGA